MDEVLGPFPVLDTDDCGGSCDHPSEPCRCFVSCRHCFPWATDPDVDLSDTCDLDDFIAEQMQDPEFAAAFRAAEASNADRSASMVDSMRSSTFRKEK